MRVLFVAPYVPSRIRVRSYHLLLGLAQRGHTVSLVAPARGQADMEALAALRPFCEQIVAVPQGPATSLLAYLRAARGPLPLQAAHTLSAAMLAALRHTLQRPFDLLHVEHLRAAEPVLATAAALGGAPPLVYDSVDCISLLFERALRASPSLSTRALALLELARTRRYEVRCLEHFQQVLATSSEDARALEILGSCYGRRALAPVAVVPNGVDLAHFAPAGESGEPATVLLSGKMSYHANQAAARFLLRRIMPLVWRARPTTRVLIVGAHPPAWLRAYADPRVMVTGYVPAMPAMMARATLAVCPLLYGVGVQNKVLEAMAMGKPVVASRQASVALAAQPGAELLVAESAEEFATALLALLADPARRRALGAGGRCYVEREHSWEASVARLERRYAAALQPDAPAVNSLSAVPQVDLERC